MNTILIYNGQPPDTITYTEDSFLILLKGAENPPTVGNFGEEHDKSGDSLIVSFLTRFRLTKRRDFARGSGYR